jgi:hypothetical protein
VIVAVVSVRVMKVVADAIVGVITVRNRLVAAARTVHMAGAMTTAGVVRGAAVGIVAGDLDHVLIDMSLMRIVEMAVMQIVDMAAVAHRGVAASGPMLVRVVAMLR